MEVFFHSMCKTKDLRYLLSRANGMKRGDTLNIRMAIDFFATPEIIVPCAGIIDYLKENGCNVKVNIRNKYLQSSGLSHPYTIEINSYDLLSPMFKVWKYSTGAEVSKLVSVFVEYLDTKAECASGVVEAFDWTANEVMDNVLQHSKSQYGYVMCAIAQNGHISFAVYDNGIGIYKSFQGSQFRFHNSFDAITSAMKQGYTRDKKTNQGNGLWGMSQFILNNKGFLNIISSGAIIGYNSTGDLYKHDFPMIKVNDKELSGTLVDFQFQCDNELSISEVFGNDYQSANLYVESREDDKEQIHLKIGDFSFGYTTRDSGKRARTYAINMATQSQEKQIVIIDFEDIGIISSSFADEFIAKLICHYGFLKFNTIFRLINIKNSNIPIINRAIMQRMSTEYESIVSIAETEDKTQSA